MKKLSIGICLAALLSGAATATPVPSSGSKAIAMSIAAAASRAERTAGLPVRTAVQEAIINAAAHPSVVSDALEQLVRACRDGRFPDASWSCPAKSETYLVIASIRGLVSDHVDQSGPAAFDTPGTAAFGSIPFTDLGGPSYRTLGGAGPGIGEVSNTPFRDRRGGGGEGIGPTAFGSSSEPPPDTVLGEPSSPPDLVDVGAPPPPLAPQVGHPPSVSGIILAAGERG